MIIDKITLASTILEGDDPETPATESNEGDNKPESTDLLEGDDPETPATTTEDDSSEAAK